MNARQYSLAGYVRSGLLCVAVTLFAACGGSGDDGKPATKPPLSFQVVSFGDSISDVGTYAPVAQVVGGGRFTTNPGQVWAQDVANFFGGTLTAAQTGGYGVSVQNHADGLGYAQGGARVTDPNGISFKPNGLGALTVPIVTQLQNHLSAHGNFSDGQLVLVQGGGSDILIHAEAVVAGSEAPADANQAVTVAAQQLAAITAKILASGAKHIVVSNVGNIAMSPRGVNNAALGTVLTGLTSTFNSALMNALQAMGIQNQVISVDQFAFINDVLANFKAKGFLVSNTGTGCNLQLLSKEIEVSSLFCSPKTYTVPDADQTYMFADEVHPTTHLHALFATLVEQAVQAANK
ncbi:SGNH/GDSL hydrolase family protein [Cupriavidus sp. IDO]|uniref:SGNH/GDSL hydrolase family protein n=1 Tax=Cupriavidus sp. IDO TaxID=1539142 RepID=UPI0005790280|nr:SGNH/GDSL hydrolase family protein [Cupriavidus sp. IDO]KWR91920.1 acylhydrolase [Cupriavidus sp. IDO]